MPRGEEAGRSAGVVEQPSAESVPEGAGSTPAPGPEGPEPTDARHGAPGPEAVQGDGPKQSRVSLALKGIAPLLLLGIFVFLFLRVGPVGVFQAAFPPVEELTIDRVVLPEPGLVRVHLVNGGPEPVTVSQVLVDEAYWQHTIEPGRTIPPLGTAEVEIPFRWVDGEPMEVTMVTSTGLTFSHEVAVATRSPGVNARYLGTFAMLGIYVGVIPVFLGLLWLPFLAGIHRRWLDFFLSFTLGLLVFLGADALDEALEMTEAVASAFQGTGLVVLGLLGTPLLIEGLGRLKGSAAGTSAVGVAYLIALGIGLHNLGEGLAIGSAYAVGEITLGTTLVLGFLLHNTTEGVGIVAPIARERNRLGRLALLGAIAGVPTILGAWIGGFSYSPVTTVLFLAIGAGAVAQVVWAIWKLLAKREGGGLTVPLNAVGLVAGLVVMYVTGMFVAV